MKLLLTMCLVVVSASLLSCGKNKPEIATEQSFRTAFQGPVTFTAVACKSDSDCRGVGQTCNPTTHQCDPAR